jgi:glycine/D-amino acid oxidase-like deaminating enzyme
MVADRLVVAFGAETFPDIFEFDARIPSLKRVWGQTVIYRSPLFSGPAIGIVKGATSLLIRQKEMRYSASSSKDSLESQAAQVRDLQEIEQNLQAIYKLSTAKLEIESQTTLIGARALSSDRKPLIGELWRNGQSALYLYTGLYKNGFQFAPQCARYLAATILNLEVPKNVSYLEGFDVKRLL